MGRCNADEGSEVSTIGSDRLLRLIPWDGRPFLCVAQTRIVGERAIDFAHDGLGHRLAEVDLALVVQLQDPFDNRCRPLQSRIVRLGKVFNVFAGMSTIAAMSGFRSKKSV